MNINELVDVVDENETVTATAVKADVYTKGLSNRIVHIFVVNPEDESLFIQKRSPHVNYLPKFYCTSAGGHVGTKESYDAAAARELEEEIGLTSKLELIEKFVYKCPVNIPTDRFISLYVCYANANIYFNDGEVADGSFMSIKDLDELIKKDENIHPQLTACVDVYKKYLKRGLGSNKQT
jgi:isopentenyl-diphosphate Delta-isomerase